MMEIQSHLEKTLDFTKQGLFVEKIYFRNT